MQALIWMPDRVLVRSHGTWTPGRVIARHRDGTLDVKRASDGKIATNVGPRYIHVMQTPELSGVGGIGLRAASPHAIEMVLRCAPRFRIPEPIRLADRLAALPRRPTSR